MQQQTQYTAQSHPARRAARAVARKNPGFDFDAPAALLNASDYKEFLAELERDFPSPPAPQPGPVANYSYAPGSYLADLLRGEAKKLLALAALHSKFVRYDKEHPESYSDECAYTWYLPELSLRALDNPVARFISQELFNTAEWSRLHKVRPMTDEGCEKCLKYVALVADRIAPFCTEGNHDLFGNI